MSIINVFQQHIVYISYGDWHVHVMGARKILNTVLDTPSCLLVCDCHSDHAAWSVRAMATCHYVVERTGLLHCKKCEHSKAILITPLPTHVCMACALSHLQHRLGVNVHHKCFPTTHCVHFLW